VKKSLAAAACLLATAASTLVAVAPAQASGSLAEHAAAHGRYFGDAVDTGEIADAAYRPHIAAEFSQLTPGNAMKWDATEPSPGQFSYARGDAIVDLAEQNGQTVRGHTLVWHSQTPGWVQNLDAAGLRAAMRDHIANVVTH
jgi:endo-1,4-beta-xylanase